MHVHVQCIKRLHVFMGGTQASRENKEQPWQSACHPGRAKRRDLHSRTTPDYSAAPAIALSLQLNTPERRVPK